MLLIKMSLGLSFLRVLSTPFQKSAAWCLVVVSTIVNLALSLFLLFACGNPIKYAEKLLGGQCVIDTVQFRFIMYFHAVVNIGVDLILLALPVSIVANSSMGTSAKISVTLIFFLACSYVRFLSMNVLSSTNPSKFIVVRYVQ
jgi:hypothetical protein